MDDARRGWAVFGILFRMSTPLDWRRCARRQHGMVTDQQLRASGLSTSTMHRMLADGELARVCQRVYSSGGAPLTLTARLWAATLATNGVVGFATAAGMWNMTAEVSNELHVVVPHSRRIKIPAGVRLHRVPLPDNARRHIDGLPLSSRPWSALDYLGSLRGSAAGTFFDRALQQGWIEPDDVHNRLRDWRGRIGNTKLRRLATTMNDGAAAESERRLHRILRDGGVSGWIANYAICVGGETIAKLDVAFPQRRLAIEIDGMAHHVDAVRFRRDRSRQNQLVLMGWTVLRFTWADLTERPGYVLAAIRQALAA